jgi:hypothetical protein
MDQGNKDSNPSITRVTDTVGNGTSKLLTMSNTNLLIGVGWFVVSVVWFILGNDFFDEYRLDKPRNWKQGIVWALIMGPAGILLLILGRTVSILIEIVQLSVNTLTARMNCVSDFYITARMKRVSDFYKKLDDHH